MGRSVSIRPVARPGVAPQLKTEPPSATGLLFLECLEIEMATYSEKLKHPLWQRKRLEIMERDFFGCQICGDGESTLHVHHKRYIKGAQPWEYKDCDLVTVCENCHDKAHGLMDKAQEFMASLQLEGPRNVNEILAMAAGFSASWGSAAGNVVGEDFFGECPSAYVVGEIADGIFWVGLKNLVAFHDLIREFGANRVINTALAALHGEEPNEFYPPPEPIGGYKRYLTDAD